MVRTCSEYTTQSHLWKEKSSPHLKSSNSKLSRYNNQNASSVPTCHILKCFPCYISSVCCIDMTENWSRQPFIDLPSGMKNCVLTWTELVHLSFPSLTDIPERGKTSLGKKKFLNFHDTSSICNSLPWFSIVCMKMLTSVKPGYRVVGISKQIRLNCSLNEEKALEWPQSRYRTSHMNDYLLCSKTEWRS